jgi:hypothetical protein
MADWVNSLSNEKHRHYASAKYLVQNRRSRNTVASQDSGWLGLCNNPLPRRLENQLQRAKWQVVRPERKLRRECPQYGLPLRLRDTSSTDMWMRDHILETLRCDKAHLKKLHEWVGLRQHSTRQLDLQAGRGHKLCIDHARSLTEYGCNQFEHNTSFKANQCKLLLNREWQLFRGQGLFVFQQMWQHVAFPANE